MKDSEAIHLFLCGDVMTGRGIDQALPYPASPVLYESYVRDARDYLRLAEEANGPIPRPVDFRYIWGDALEELGRMDVRIINLETSITDDGAPWPDKGIHYRMSRRNVPCLTAAGIDCCCLANNHALDWGYEGLADTLSALDIAKIAHAGLGQNVMEAAAPAVIGLARGARVLVWAIGCWNSGIPREWEATETRPGVHVLRDLSGGSAERISAQVRAHKREGDVAIISIHWGGNWGHDIPAEQVAFAHRLIDDGVDLIHCHSSHHVKALEIYRERLILYGCGDFVTDYEGISGYEEFRSDLSLLYLVEFDPRAGRLLKLRMVPMQMRHLRLSHASRTDAEWLCRLLNDLGKLFGTEMKLDPDNSLMLRQ